MSTNFFRKDICDRSQVQGSTFSAANFQIGNDEAGRYSLKYASKNGLRGQKCNLEPLNPWPRPIIGTIHAKSTV